MVAFNWMAATGRIQGITPAEISARYPTAITPAGYGFSIWALIYVGLIAFGVYQLLPRNLARFRPVRSLYIFSCALNCAWLFFWQNDQIGVCLWIIAALVVVLAFINVKIQKTDSALESLLVKGTLGIYFGWVAVALCVNFAVFLVYANIGLKGWENLFGTCAVLVAAAFGVSARVKMTNYFVPLAVAWALTAIAVEQSGKTLIVAAAAVGVIACLIASLSFVLELPSSSNE